MTGTEIATVKIEFTLPSPATPREVGSLDVIVSTNFTETTVQESIYSDEVSEILNDLNSNINTKRTTTKLLYAMKDEFSLTESFSQDFRLDPDDPRLAVEISNNTSHNLSVRFTILLDGEVEDDERESFTSGNRSIRWWAWSTTNQ
ncbi:MAG: hypothetical protein OXI63_09395 [Candidatus Poribacteria bacterium]|nr:hypothetical protein [Candidatus Poribacteria bacterium]